MRCTFKTRVAASPGRDEQEFRERCNASPNFRICDTAVSYLASMENRIILRLV